MENNELFAEFLNYVHIKLEKEENGYNLYNTEEEDYINDLEDNPYDNTTDVFATLNVDVCDRLCGELQVELDRCPNICQKYQFEFESYTKDFMVDDWSSIGKSMLKSANEDEHEFYRNHEQKFKMCDFVTSNKAIKDVNLDEVYKIQQKAIELK